ncbi:MAG: cadmium-translocating P-type ATPase [Thermoplasmata archaeon]|nr:cadmium-translocating P-type ATPase [Thermoplasmata archaeon]
MRKVYGIEIDCANCAREVEEAISKVEGVDSVTVAFIERKMFIEIADERFDEVMARVGEAAVAAESDFRFWPYDDDEEDEEEDEEKEFGHGFVFRIVLGMVFVILGITLEYGIIDVGIDTIWLQAIYTVVLAIVGYSVFISGAKNLVRGGFLDEHLLMAIATVAAIITQFYTESVAVMTFYLIGEWFEDRAVDSTRRDVKRLVGLKITHASVFRDGKVVTVHPREVAVGDSVVVRPGETFPVDGTVISGSSLADTKALTGESVPRAISEGDAVLSGFINTDSAVTIRADKPYEDSSARKMLELIEESAAKKSRSEKFITRFARVYTPAVVLCAALLAVGGGLATSDWSRWIEMAIIFLVVSCPCALVVSVPLTYFCGIGNASKNYILVKGSTCIESLAHADTVVFDKTGTLTDGSFSVRSVDPAEGFDENTVTDLAACAEMFSTHPIAKSILAYRGSAPDAARVSDAVVVGGKGVRAVVDGRKVTVGSRMLMSDEGIEVPGTCEGAGTDIYVSADGRYAGHILISDRIKDDSAEAVARLRKDGVRTFMLTGDNEAAGKATSETLGLDGYKAGMLPADKITELESIMSASGGTTVFVGDGINDSPSLARADVGIAMGAVGSDAAVEAADVVIIDDMPSRIPKAIDISKKTQRVVTENIILALAAKFGIMIATPFGLTNMWIAIIGDVGVLIICILNAMRAMGSGPRIPAAQTAPAEECRCGCCHDDEDECHCHEHEHHHEHGNDDEDECHCHEHPHEHEHDERCHCHSHCEKKPEKEE